MCEPTGLTFNESVQSVKLDGADGPFRLSSVKSSCSEFWEAGDSRMIVGRNQPVCVSHTGGGSTVSKHLLVVSGYSGVAAAQYKGSQHVPMQSRFSGIGPF